MNLSSCATGANLGGWLVMEDWLFPNVPLLRLGARGIESNQELDYIARMARRKIDAVASMHAHWNTYLDPDLLGASRPPESLQQLRAAGVTQLRIPVGWWAFEAPVGGSSHLDRGLTADGFVSGGIVYLHALLRHLRPLGMTAVIDMHSLPGGAVRNMGYTGRYFSSAEAFTGADEWAEDGDASSLPSTAHAPLRQSVRALLALAKFVASLEGDEATAGVVAGLAPWNEALFADDEKARRLLPPFALKLLPQLRALLPAARYAIYLNWFNGGRDWAAWMAEHAADLGPNVIAELHIYHAFDPPIDPYALFSPAACPMCTPGAAGMRSLVCKACGPDAAVMARYRDAGVRFVVGEWSLGTCGMYGSHPATIVDPDFLYAFYGASRSAFCASGAEADFFWAAVLRTGGYDPTAYAAAGPGSRAAIEAELRAAMAGDGWRRANAWSSPPLEPVGDDYLLNWHLGRLAATNTSAGHPVPTLRGVRGACDFEPAVAPAMAAVAMEGACDACGLAQVGSILPYVLPLLALAIAACGWCCAGRRCPAARRRLVDRLCCRRPHLQRLAEPLLET